MKHLKAAGRRLALYLDDLLLLAGSACFVRAAWELGGRPAALLVAGGCLVAYAWSSPGRGEGEDDDP